MKTIIYYYSKYNHTKNYAESLASRIVCDTFSYKEMSAKKMQEFDTIIFMAPVHNNKIVHVDKFLKLYEKIKDKNLFIVAVGMQASDKDRRDSLIITNLLNYYHIRLYELQGGFDMGKLPFVQRKIIKTALNHEISKNPMLQANQNRIEDLFKFPVEYNDINGIDRIMDTIHRIERNVKA